MGDSDYEMEEIPESQGALELDWGDIQVKQADTAYLPKIYTRHYGAAMAVALNDWLEDEVEEEQLKIKAQPYVAASFWEEGDNAIGATCSLKFMDTLKKHGWCKRKQQHNKVYYTFTELGKEFIALFIRVPKDLRHPPRTIEEVRRIQANDLFYQKIFYFCKKPENFAKMANKQINKRRNSNILVQRPKKKPRKSLPKNVIEAHHYPWKPKPQWIQSQSEVPTPGALSNFLDGMTTTNTFNLGILMEGPRKQVEERLKLCKKNFIAITYPVHPDLLGSDEDRYMVVIKMDHTKKDYRTQIQRTFCLERTKKKCWVPGVSFDSSYDRVIYYLSTVNLDEQYRTYYDVVSDKTRRFESPFSIGPAKAKLIENERLEEKQFSPYACPRDIFATGHEACLVVMLELKDKFRREHMEKGKKEDFRCPMPEKLIIYLAEHICEENLSRNLRSRYANPLTKLVENKWVKKCSPSKYPNLKAADKFYVLVKKGEELAREIIARNHQINARPVEPFQRTPLDQIHPTKEERQAYVKSKWQEIEDAKLLSPQPKAKQKSSGRTKPKPCSTHPPEAARRNSAPPVHSERSKYTPKVVKRKSAPSAEESPKKKPKLHNRSKAKPRKGKPRSVKGVKNEANQLICDTLLNLSLHYHGRMRGNWTYKNRFETFGKASRELARLEWAITMENCERITKLSGIKEKTLMRVKQILDNGKVDDYDAQYDSPGFIPRFQPVKKQKKSCQKKNAKASNPVPQRVPKPDPRSPQPRVSAAMSTAARKGPKCLAAYGVKTEQNQLIVDTLNQLGQYYQGRVRENRKNWGRASTFKNAARELAQLDYAITMDNCEQILQIDNISIKTLMRVKQILQNGTVDDYLPEYDSPGFVPRFQPVKKKKQPRKSDPRSPQPKSSVAKPESRFGDALTVVDKLNAIRGRCLERERCGGKKYPRLIRSKDRTESEEKEREDAQFLKEFKKNLPTSGPAKRLFDEIMSWKRKRKKSNPQVADAVVEKNHIDEIQKVPEPELEPMQDDGFVPQNPIQRADTDDDAELKQAILRSMQSAAEDERRRAEKERQRKAAEEAIRKRAAQREREQREAAVAQERARKERAAEEERRKAQNIRDNSKRFAKKRMKKSAANCIEIFESQPPIDSEDSDDDMLLPIAALPSESAAPRKKRKSSSSLYSSDEEEEDESMVLTQSDTSAPAKSPPFQPSDDEDDSLELTQNDHSTPAKAKLSLFDDEEDSEESLQLTQTDYSLPLEKPVSSKSQKARRNVQPESHPDSVPNESEPKLAPRRSRRSRQKRKADPAFQYDQFDFDDEEKDEEYVEQKQQDPVLQDNVEEAEKEEMDDLARAIAASKQSFEEEKKRKSKKRDLEEPVVPPRSKVSQSESRRKREIRRPPQRVVRRSRVVDSLPVEVNLPETDKEILEEIFKRVEMGSNDLSFVYGPFQGKYKNFFWNVDYREKNPNKKCLRSIKKIRNLFDNFRRFSVGCRHMDLGTGLGDYILGFTFQKWSMMLPIFIERKTVQDLASSMKTETYGTRLNRQLCAMEMVTKEILEKCPSLEPFCSVTVLLEGDVTRQTKTDDAGVTRVGGEFQSKPSLESWKKQVRKLEKYVHVQKTRHLSDSMQFLYEIVENIDMAGVYKAFNDLTDDQKEYMSLEAWKKRTAAKVGWANHYAKAVRGKKHESWYDWESVELKERNAKHEQRMRRNAEAKKQQNLSPNPLPLNPALNSDPAIVPPNPLPSNPNPVAGFPPNPLPSNPNPVANVAADEVIVEISHPLSPEDQQVLNIKQELVNIGCDPVYLSDEEIKDCIKTHGDEALLTLADRLLAMLSQQ